MLLTEHTSAPNHRPRIELPVLCSTSQGARSGKILLTLTRLRRMAEADA